MPRKPLDINEPINHQHMTVIGDEHEILEAAITTFPLHTYYHIINITELANDI